MSKTTSPSSRKPSRPSFGPLFPPAGEKQRQQQLSSASEVQKGHGRLVRRHLQASSRLAKHLDWPGLAQVCRLERVTQRGGKETIEVQHAITSLAPERADARLLLSFWRKHWHIENKLHWVRDVTLGEDGCRVKLGHGPQNLAACRNAALNLLRLDGANGIAATLRHYACRPWELLKLIGILKN